MITSPIKHSIIALAVSALLMMYACSGPSGPSASASQPISATPIIVGAMKNVMRKGELFARISIDTIANKTNLCGFGPVENLKGEITIIDGHAYKAQVITDSTMSVTESFQLKAPFFGYAHISGWLLTPMPDTVQNLAQLEDFLNQTTKNSPRPFFFKITARMEQASVHVMNLPDGTKVTSPEDAAIGKRSFPIANSDAELIGFFSTEHKTIFTHHDTFLHIHLITSDKHTMGHLDKMTIAKGSAKLFLPENQ